MWVWGGGRWFVNEAASTQGAADISRSGNTVTGVGRTTHFGGDAQDETNSDASS